MSSVLDMIAGRVHGAVKARDVRILWTDGLLYVCHSASGSIVAYPCERPKRHAGSWVTKLTEGDVRFTAPGCGSCRRRVAESAVGRMSVEDIVAAGALADA